MMTTLWPIFVLGIVSTLLILAPSIVRAIGETKRLKSVSTSDESELDHSLECEQHWMRMFIASSLPLALVLLLLWGAAVGQISGYGLWIPLVILLPTLGSALYAQQLRHQDEESRD